MNNEEIQQIETILRAYQNDVLSNMVIEQILVLLGQLDVNV